MKKIKLDLDNPIFVIYVNTENMTSSSAQRMMEETMKVFDVYENVTNWFIPSGESKIECVYEGKHNKHDKELIKLITEINQRVEILTNSNDFEDFKLNFRDWRIDNILDEQT